MSTLKLDARQPLIVIAGAFNPAIFNPNWTAINLHGFAFGDPIDVLQAVVDNQGGMLSFMKGVALGVSPSRLDGYVLTQDEAKTGELEKVILKAVEVLPHTPLFALGCNFLFVEEDPSSALLEIFNTPEGVEGEYPAHDRQFSVQMDIDDAVLNFTRSESNGTVQFSFNYHRALNASSDYTTLIPGLIKRSREHAEKLLKSLYDLDNYEIIGFLPTEQEDPANAEAAPDQILESNHGQGWAG